MKIAILGTGYVGLVTGACLAGKGHEVWCVDKNETKIANLQKKIVPIFEPGLETLVARGLEERRLFFTTDLKEAAAGAALCFLTVDTPAGRGGAPNIDNVLIAAANLGAVLQPPLLVVTKSTVPVGTTRGVLEILQAKLKERGLPAEEVAVASNPEFLKEGSSVRDFLEPDRVVVGVENSAHAEILRELYRPFLKTPEQFLVMDIASAELAKYAANAMLACRISFINEIAALCEKTGADVEKIRQALGTDPRIGPHFLYAGLGFGGSCFPKDVTALLALGEEHQVWLPVVEGAQATNDRHKERFASKIYDHLQPQQPKRVTLKNKTIALWGLAFKPQTDDIREAVSLHLIQSFRDWGAGIRAFDPAAMENVRRLETGITLCEDKYDCLQGADCLVIVTEWDEFRRPDFARMKSLMKRPLIFDGRNIFNPAQMKELGFDYHSQGR